MKRCPFCAEEIQDEAVKCRYCQSSLSDQLAPITSSQPAPQPPVANVTYVLPPPAPAVASSVNQQAKTVVTHFSLAGGLIAALAILPGLTSIALLILEFAMCDRIGRLYLGANYSLGEQLKGIGCVFLLALTGKVFALILLETLTFAGCLAPVVTHAIKGGVAFVIVLAIGNLVISHYEQTVR